MKDHIKRKTEIFRDVVPEEGTKEFEMLQAAHARRNQSDPDFDKEIGKKFEKAVRTLEVQNSSGVDLGIDRELRYYLEEFNNRSWSYGHRSMPIMFNVMEAFFNLDKSVNSWKLLDEEDYELSFFGFLDYYTSKELRFDSEQLKENFQQDLIYNYHVSNDIDKLTFKTGDNKEFIVAGISLVRRGNEITIFFLTGEVTDTVIATKELGPIILDSITPGKEKIEFDKTASREAVPLLGNSQWWKTLVACRFDITEQTIDARYVARDDKVCFDITTDDATGFRVDGGWLDAKNKGNVLCFAGKSSGLQFDL